MGSPRGADSDQGFSRREVLALAGAVGIVGASASLPAEAHAGGSPAALAARRAAVQRSSLQTAASPAPAGPHPLEPLSAWTLPRRT
jgi:hypothetical protein